MSAGFWWGNLKKRDNLKDLGVDGRIILKLVFKTQDRVLAWINLIQVVRCCEYDKEISGFMKCGEFLNI